MSPAVDGIFRGNRSVVGSSLVDYLDAAGIEQSIGLSERCSSTRSVRSPRSSASSTAPGGAGSNDVDEPARRTGGARHRRQPARDHRSQAGSRLHQGRDPCARADPRRACRVPDAHAAHRGARGIRAGRLRQRPAARHRGVAPSYRSPHRASIPGTSAAVGEFTTVDDHRGVPPARTELHVIRDLGVARGHGPDITELCLSLRSPEASGRCRSAAPTANTFLGTAGLFPPHRA